MALDGKYTFSFALDVPADEHWRNIDLLRNSVQNCFTAVFSNVEGRQAVAMITSELLENALKYGDWDRADGPSSFRLRISGARDRAEVTVENPVTNATDHLARLQRLIDWIDSFDDPAQAYRARLMQLAQGEDADQGVSRLGLVRICYEGNSRLEAHVNGDMLTVSAKMRFDPEAREKVSGRVDAT